MSRVGVGVSVMCAAVLTLIAAVLYRAPAAAQGDDTPTILVPFNASQAHTLEVISTDATVAARRTGRSLDWWITIDEDGTRRIWPASQQRVRGALRILGEIQPQGADAGTAFTPEATLTVRGDEGEFSAQLAARTFAGRGVIRPIGADASLLTVPSALNDMVLRPGPASWRDILVFGDVRGAGASEVNRIGLTTRDQSLLLARIQGRWWIHPEADLSQTGLRADRAAVDALLKALSETRVDQFIDDQRDPAQLGLSDPTAILTIRSARRLESGERRERLRELRVGLPVGLGTQSLFAVLDDTRARDAAGDDLTYVPQIIGVDATSLASLAMTPAAYMSKVAIDTPASDVGRVIISDMENQPVLDITRTLEGWRLTGLDTPPAREEVDAIESLLTLAADTSGQPMLTGDAEFSTICSVELYDLGGAAIDTLEFGLAAGEQEDAPLPVLTNERELRLYEAGAADAMLVWLTR